MQQLRRRRRQDSFKQSWWTDFEAQSIALFRAPNRRSSAWIRSFEAGWSGRGQHQRRRQLPCEHLLHAHSEHPFPRLRCTQKGKPLATSARHKLSPICISERKSRCIRTLCLPRFDPAGTILHVVPFPMYVPLQQYCRYQPSPWPPCVLHVGGQIPRGFNGPNLQWILDDDSSIDMISSMDGIELSVSSVERRAAYYMDTSVPRTVFKVQVQHSVSSKPIWVCSKHLYYLRTPRSGGASYFMRTDLDNPSFWIMHSNNPPPRTSRSTPTFNYPKAGSNLDSSWLPGFDQRFECQHLAQGQRLVGGSCTWYTN